MILCGLRATAIVALGLAILTLPRHDAQDTGLVVSMPQEVPRGTCWVFTHLNKAGGTTIKGLLDKWSERYNTTLGAYTGGLWREGSQGAKEYWSEGYMVTTGGYAETLRSIGAAECKWFTTLRQPVTRLVSAYMYCRRPRGRDQLCGYSFADAHKVDIATFAEHWGNYGMRQFALAFVLPDVVLNSTLAKECPRCPSWYLVKDYLRQEYATEGDAVDEGMIRFIEPVKELIANNYTAVGILEDFNSTLHLFNRALGIPGMDWPEYSRTYGARNTMNAEYEEAKREVLKAAEGDPRIKNFLRLDFMLYDYALSIHQEQLLQYGLA